nr:callose synthase 10 [Tanacetum cinerariifolium]
MTLIHTSRTVCLMVHHDDVIQEWSGQEPQVASLNDSVLDDPLCIGPTYAILKFIEYCLDVLLMFGA